MESSPPRATSSGGPAAGVKRPASLLPAFEPLSSSPSLPRPQKRVARDAGDYPTPLPTSSTHILSSSPPHLPMARPMLQRSVFSTSTERAPLSTVPALMLPESGEPLLMGRSSASCHHQLSANRLISRVHVKATFKPAGNPFDRDRVEIMCTGWNGIKLHCQGKTYDLAKGKSFTSDIKDADIMIDVHDARVLVQWPRSERKGSASTESDPVWDASSPQRNFKSHRDLDGSPIKEPPRLASPTSPSPIVRSRIPPSSPLLSPSRLHNTISIYEDESSPTPEIGRAPEATNKSHTTTFDGLNSSQRNALSHLTESFDDFSDHDEENDPIIHSFGPFGDNLLPRMASFRAGDSPTRAPRPRVQLEPLRPVSSPPQPVAVKSETNERKEEESEEEPKVDERRAAAISAIQNHAANQLAFSRLSSTPFSTILQNLPASLWRDEVDAFKRFSRHEIRAILEDTKYVGEVIREGKDAAGKALESEFYYIPDFDEDEMRRQAVVNDLRKPGLRNCRKQHKQYYWRKPK